MTGAGLLAVDVGNTATKVGLFDGTELAARLSYATDPGASADALAERLRELAASARGGAAIAALSVCSVVPALTDRYRDVAGRLGVPMHTVRPERSGIEMDYAPASSLGADRIANVAGALSLVGPPVIVVDVGTVAKIEAADASGRYRGGAILPGIATGLMALSAGTAQLPEVEPQPPSRTIGTTTDEAMRSGVVLGLACALEGLVRRFRDELGCEAPIVATGGDCDTVLACCSISATRVPDLTLIGIRVLWERECA
jgi:type III pantothenate kinase